MKTSDVLLELILIPLCRVLLSLSQSRQLQIFQLAFEFYFQKYKFALQMIIRFSEMNFEKQIANFKLQLILSNTNETMKLNLQIKQKGS